MRIVHIEHDDARHSCWVTIVIDCGSLGEQMVKVAVNDDRDPVIHLNAMAAALNNVRRGFEAPG